MRQEPKSGTINAARTEAQFALQPLILSFATSSLHFESVD